MSGADDGELLARVRELRERGSSPKQIARALGLRPAVVAPLVRRLAEQEQSGVDPADHALLGCWINPGWSSGLGLDGAPKWATLDPAGAGFPPSSGLASVLIARQERASRATVCGFLVDVYCLGVKNVTGPTRMAADSVEAHRRKFYASFDEPPLAVPVELAQHVVHGAVAYARSLGFEPPDDFAPAARHLGTPTGPTPIRFGRDGAPLYISGPHDNPRKIIATLEATAGSGNYHYLTHL